MGGSVWLPLPVSHYMQVVHCSLMGFTIEIRRKKRYVSSKSALMGASKIWLSLKVLILSLVQ